MEKNCRGQKGFTLIELLLVVTIIGILAALAVPAYSRYVSSAKAGEALTHLHALVQYAHSYAQAHPTDWSQTGRMLYYNANDTGDASVNDLKWVQEVCGLTPVYFSYTYEGPETAGNDCVLVATGGRLISANGLAVSGSPFTSNDWVKARINSNGTISWTSSVGKMEEIVPTN